MKNIKRMKPILILTLAMLFCSCKNINNNSVDVETIWENHLKNFGNKEQISKIKTVSYVTKIDFINSNKTGRFECIIKNEKLKLHFISDNIDATTIFDGENFIRYINGVRQEVPKSEESGILRNADFFHEVNYKKHGYKIKLEGTERINNLDVYKVKYYSDDLTTFLYIDKNDYSLIKTKDDFQEFWPSNLKTKNGINYFSKYKNTDQYETSVGEIISIEFNCEVNDSVFYEYK